MRELRKIAAILLVIVILVENPQNANANSYIRDLPQGVLSMTSLFEGSLDGSVEDGFEFQIIYKMNGGLNSPLNPEEYDITQVPFTLQVPTRSGYNFAGWYTDNQFTNKITNITERNCQNYIIYAKWTKEVEANRNVELYSYHTDSMISGSDRKLSECKYSFLDEVQIPGMPSTREMDLITQRISSESQCPQGICFAKDYILVTAYAAYGGKVGSLHVFDRRTGEYLVTLGMKSTSHLGGVAFDGENVWICHSDNQTLERLSYNFIRLLANMKSQKCIDCTDSIMEYRVENRPSCITYADGHLWVATQTNFFKSVMFSYVYEDDKLVADGYYRIPEKVQGIAFGDNGEVYLSTSLGRTKSSYLKVYGSLRKLDANPGKPMIKVEMPPCAEEIEVADGKVYVLFESAGFKYMEGMDGKGTSLSPIDEILEIELASL